MTNKLLFARVTTKAWNTARANKMWEYKLSDNSLVLFKTDKLSVGSWYFFEFAKDVLGNHTYVSHSPIDTKQALAFEQELCTTKALTHKVVNMWQKLEAADRQLLMREFGMAIGVVTTASLAWQGISAFIAEEAFLGPATGGLSLIAAAGMAGFTYLQYEERKHALANRQKMFNEYIQQLTLMKREAMCLIPRQYRHLEFDDPQAESIVTKLKYMINNIDLSNLFSLQAEEYQFAGAAA